MKILIMVLSYNEPPFDKLMNIQKQTWASIATHDFITDNNTPTIFYHGTENKTEEPLWFYDGTLQVPLTDNYYLMAGKFKYALEYATNHNWEFDLIFRTNSSSYVNKKVLLEFSETLPKEKLYSGWTFEDSNDDKGLCVSGAGIWLSRDTAEILMNQIDPEKEIEEDVEIGRILRRNGITAIDDKSRFDIPLHFGIVPFDRYHYRCKSGPANRIADIGNMKKLHHLLMSNYR